MSLYIDSKYVKLVSSRLRNFKQKNTNLWNFSCPICGDSKKNILKARGYVFSKGNNLFYRCHNCGVSTNVGNLIKHVDSALHKEYILERYKAGESGNSNFKDPSFDIPSPRFDRVESQKIFEHAEWCDKLPPGHFCLEYLKKRKIPKQYYNKLLFTSYYKQFIDTLIPNHGKKIIDDARLIIPFYDKYNELIAVSGRALETFDYKLRYVTIRTFESDEKLIYGMERIDVNQHIKIVEGPFDSLFLNNCVASGDANLDITAKKLIEMGISKNNITLCPDREPRNKEVVKNIKKFIDQNYNVCLFPDTLYGKDINEYVIQGFSSEHLEEMIKRFTYNGLRSLIQYNQWKKI